MLLYKPWRRRVDQARQIRHQPQQLQEDEETGTVVENEVAMGAKDVRRHEEDSIIADHSSRRSPANEAEPQRNIAEDVVL